MSQKPDYVGLAATGGILGAAAFALKGLVEDGVDLVEQLEENVKKSEAVDKNGKKKARPWWQAG